MNYVEFLVFGRLVIWTIQTSSLLKRVWSGSNLLTELVTCDFCLGFWIYLLLSVALGYNGFDDQLPIHYFLSAIGSSFLMHVFVLGWRSKFGTVILE